MFLWVGWSGKQRIKKQPTKPTNQKETNKNLPGAALQENGKDKYILSHAFGQIFWMNAVQRSQH